jgi:hypothetical protein
VSARLRNALEGNGLVLGAALFFLALGLILIPVVFLSSVQWTGTAVQGVERGGLVYYSYKGQNYSLDDTSRFNTNTVYFKPKHPDTTAELGNPPIKVVDVASVAVPFLIGFAIAGVEARRHLRGRRLRRARNDAEPVGFGQGLDREVLHRLLEQRRQDDQN